MTKNKQIEEMEKVLPATIKDPLDNIRYIIFGKSLRRAIAQIYYNAGYRKIDENCAMITKAEWKEYQKQAYLQVFETLTNRLEKHYSQFYTSMAVIMQAITDEIQMIVLDKYCEHLNVAQEVKELKQRAVQKFADDLKEYPLESKNLVREYGVGWLDCYNKLKKAIDELLKEYK